MKLELMQTDKKNREKMSVSFFSFPNGLHGWNKWNYMSKQFDEGNKEVR